MTLNPRHWPTKTSATGPSPAVNQTADALFAWAYVATFAASLPFYWFAALAKPPADTAPAPLSQAPNRRAK